MCSFQVVFTIFLWGMFSFAAFSNPVLTNIREKGSTTNFTFTTKIENKTILSAKKSLKPFTPIPPNQNDLFKVVHVASEGGMVLPTLGTHNGRENVLEQPASQKLNNESTGASIASVKLSTNKLVIPDIAPQQDDEKPSVPKKGVNFSEFDIQSKSVNKTDKINLKVNNSTNVSALNITTGSSISVNHSLVIHKKPLITKSDDDYIDVINTKGGVSKENTISIDEIDPLLVKKENTSSDYIVPIVAVILSVPLVAILTSILYKRTTDWWQHRNYKRMDFLIEGMYHN